MFQRFASLGDQPRVLHRNDRLRREILQERDLLVGEWLNFLAVNDESAENVSSLRSAMPKRAVCRSSR